MKIIIWLVLVIALLAAGFAAGYPMGQSIGFTKGSEWALVQADIVAREVGVFMPVSFDDGQFRVVLKQPRGLYRSTWRLADRQNTAMLAEGKSLFTASGNISLSE